jgi:hypothetical protein
VQELSSLTGLALHSRIRKIPNGAGEPQSLGSPHPCAAGQIEIAWSEDYYEMAWTMPHFEEIQLNCESILTRVRGYNFLQTNLGFN